MGTIQSPRATWRKSKASLMSSASSESITDSPLVSRTSFAKFLRSRVGLLLLDAWHNKNRFASAWMRLTLVSYRCLAPGASAAYRGMQRRADNLHACRLHPGPVMPRLAPTASSYLVNPTPTSPRLWTDRCLRYAKRSTINTLYEGVGWRCDSAWQRGDSAGPAPLDTPTRPGAPGGSPPGSTAGSTLDEPIARGGEPQVAGGHGGSADYRNWLGRTAVITSGAVSVLPFVSVGRLPSVPHLLPVFSSSFVCLKCFSNFFIDIPKREFNKCMFCGRRRRKPTHFATSPRKES